MGEGLEVELFGPLDALHAALRRRAPQVAAAPAQAPGVGDLGALGIRLYVSYRHQPTRWIAWDGDAETYVWSSGPDAGAKLAADVEKAATRVAWALGAPVSPEPPGLG